MTTEQIFKKIYQELKEEMTSNSNKIFLKEYIIPSINYSKNQASEDMYFASGIEMELTRMMAHFNYEIYFSSYKDKYFFSNVDEIVKQKMLLETKTEDTKEIKLKIQLIEKMTNEYSTFKKELEQKTPQEIIEKAYELVVKKEIKDELENRDYSKSELKALLKQDDILTEFYGDWMRDDGRLGEIIQYSIEDTIDIIEENYRIEKEQKNKESR